jgi:hypothetical protein
VSSGSKAISHGKIDKSLLNPEKGNSMRPRAQLRSVKLEQLRPTQITVGKLEVDLKRQQWAAMKKAERKAALDDHWFPGILGPDGKYYIVDHHHFGLALIQEGVKSVSLMLLKDLSWLTHGNFWTVMDHHNWTHPYDSEGVRCSFADIPAKLQELADDPYRSLAGELRKAGGFSKDVTPFNEFLWADFFRHRIQKNLVLDDFKKALSKAMKMARTQEARYLPGWTGQIEAG